MEFRVLGPLEVHDEGAGVVHVRAAKERALLAILLLHANEVVSRERLIDQLWGGQPPESAANVLQTYVSHLRQLLEPDERDGESGLILTRPPGYLIRLEPGQLDLDRFDAFVAEARSTDDPAVSVRKLEDALALWRGPPLQEFAREDFAQAEIARLDELRLSAIEERIDAQLRLGRHRQDGELEPHPTDPSVPVSSPQQQPVARAPRPEVRKTVTIVFSDLVDSTRLSSQLDPEACRRLLTRYFDEMRAVVERHGGVVEKYIGDAIMAVFGVPLLHENDALRAVRAAAEMREGLAALNEEVERKWGVRLKARTGVNTGEVIAGDHSQGHMFVTGEAVSVAKRLEEIAATSEILIGNSTHRLVRDAVLAEPADRRPSKGGELAAFRLVGVLGHALGHARRFDSPLVGRDRQLEALLTVFRNAANDRTCHLLTVLGSAGVGKSRLVQEFAAALDPSVTVLRGRCLPYGEGITYWPLAEVVRDLARAEGQNATEPLVTIAGKLAGEEKSALIAERIGEALGLVGPGAGKSEETFWAVRKLFESLARGDSLVVVFDDVHWAEPTFLDLVEHVADFSRDAPILLLCIARPELLDERPGWGGGKLNATSILLEPLSEAECRRLIANLVDGAPLPGDTESRIAEAAGGNALFAEELVAMLIDDELLMWDDGHWTAADDLSDLPVPSTINTLLAARLEALPDDERALIAQASVEGAVFHRSAVAGLAPGSLAPALERCLMALVRRDVIRPEATSFAGDDAYRFRHVLIRDAAYRSLPKETRADLHGRIAGWLERAAGERLREYEEIVGYHLEQAYRYRLELGSSDVDSASLAVRAAERLESVGRRALARGDLPAAIGLLERAAELLARHARRAALLPELGAALIESGRLRDAEFVLAEARQLATSSRDVCAESHALIQEQFLRLLRVADGGTDEAAKVVERVVPVFERCGDHRGLCRAHRLQAWLHWNEARAAAAAAAWAQAAAHARRAGDEDDRAEILGWIAASLLYGPTTVAEGIRRCEQIRGEVSGNLVSEAWTLRPLAVLHAMDGRFQLARELLATSNAVLQDLGLTVTSASAGSQTEALVEMLAGNPAAAESSLRSGYRALEEMGERAYLSTTAAFLAQAIFAQERSDEAARFTELSEKLAQSGDLATQVMWRGVRARILAQRGRAGEAETLAREAVTLAEQTDFVTHRARALIDLGEVLHEAGRLDEAALAVADGVRLYEQKGNVVAAWRTRSEFAQLVGV